MPILNLQDLEKLGPKQSAPSGRMSLDELMQLPEKQAAPEPRYGGYLDKIIPPNETLPTVRANKAPTLTQRVLGNNNPISKTYDIVKDAVAEVPQVLGGDPTEPLNFATAAPFRALQLPTPGDAAAYFGYTGANDAERRFVEKNPGIMTAFGALGEVAPGVTGILGQGVGSAASSTLPAPRPTIPGSAAVRRAQANMGENGAYGTIVENLPGTLDEFTNQVATGAARFDVRTNRRTLDILGEEMTRHRGNVPAAQAATVSRIVNEFGITPQSAQAQIRRLSSVHEDSPLMLAEYPAVAASDATQRLRAPGNIDLDALGRIEDTATHWDLDYLANNGNAQSAQNVLNAISRRQETLDPFARETLGDIGPQVRTGPRTTRPSTIVDTAQMVDDATRVGGQEYRAAYRGPINNRVSFYWLPRILDANLNRAAGRAGDVRDAIVRAVDQFYIDTPQGQRLAMSTLQQLQDARGAVRGQMRAYERQGRDDLAGAVRPFYDQITRVMTRMSPQWRRANDRWADMKFMEVAQELGDTFAGKAGPRYREQLEEFRRLAPEAQDIVRVHFLQQYLDKLDNLGDTHSISKLWANEHSRNMIRTMFGDQAAVQFARMVRDQKVAEKTGGMTKNSKTHKRGVTQQQRDAETGLVAAVENANVQGARNWILERAQQMLTEHRNRSMANILTTPMSDTARVAQHLHRMRMQQEALRTAGNPRATTMPNPVTPLPGITIDYGEE